MKLVLLDLVNLGVDYLMFLVVNLVLVNVILI